MSTAPPAGPPRAPLPEGAIACSRCGATVPREQDWCLECGLAARTRLAPTPRWQVPLVAAAVVSLLALVALAVAFVDLTEDPEIVPARTTTAPAVSQGAPAATTPPATTPPANLPQEQPPATTGNPTATAPAAPDAPGTGGDLAP